jgi:hypothetical protein
VRITFKSPFNRLQERESSTSLGSNSTFSSRRKPRKEQSSIDPAILAELKILE